MATTTTCCIVGGGPAGMMLGYMLARQGVEVTVLEKHKDFNRDFRGDTVHPSTLEVMHELGLLEDFLKLPHQRLSSAGGLFGGYAFRAADFGTLPTRCKFVALMPQWDFLKFLSSHAQQFPSFHLRMQTEVTDLVQDQARVRGVVCKTPDGTDEIHADLVVGCDGRHSRTRQAANFKVIEEGVPVDVLWFRLHRDATDPENLFGNINYGSVLILIPRGDYFQAGLVIRKGSFARIQSEGLPAFQSKIARIAPLLVDRVQELQTWDQVKLLSVQINRLQRWHRPGLLCIGDAAHAMSPVGGVGINLAIQDAVATANLLAQPLLEQRVTEALLAQLQRRRELPTRATQFIQVMAHKALQSVFANPGPAIAPWQLRTLVQIPGIQRIPARVVGMGFRPEHVRGAVQEKPRPTARRTATIFGLAVAGTAAALGALAAWRSLTARRRFS